jgi:hypothetical protein
MSSCVVCRGVVEIVLGSCRVCGAICKIEEFEVKIKIRSKIRINPIPYGSQI